MSKDIYKSDLEEMRDLWVLLIGSAVTEGQISWWLERYGVRDTCRAIRRTFAAFKKRGGEMELEYQIKYCSTVARNFAEKNLSSATLRKHNYQSSQGGVTR